LTHPEGGFYAALDADSEGEEGKYYVWKAEEIKEILGPGADLFIKFYQVNGEGYWEGGKNILLKKYTLKEMAKSLKIDPASLKKHIKASEKKLLIEREKRVRPGLDDKIITAWNGMMMKAYIDAFRVFKNSKYLARALTSYQFIQEHLKRSDGGLWHTWKDQKASINGFCDDYAFVIEAIISLYEATSEEKYLQEATAQLQYVIEHFFDEKDSLFFYTSNLDPALVARKKELFDTVIPSSNSVMANILFRMGELLNDQQYLDISEKMIGTMKELMVRHPGSHANWGINWINFSRPYHTVVVAGNEHGQKTDELSGHFLPNVSFAGAADSSDLDIFKDRFKERETLIYVCSRNSCKYPVEKVTEAIRFIER
jgi:uncharacterized protein YyaL (SSP411 family)